MPKLSSRVQSTPAFHKNSATRRQKAQYIDSWREVLEAVAQEFEKTNQDPKTLTVYVTRYGTSCKPPKAFKRTWVIDKDLLNTKESKQIQIVKQVMKAFLNYEVNLQFDPDVLERVIKLPKTFDADLESNIIRNRAKLYRQRLRHGFVYQADSDVLHLMSKNQKKKSLYRTID